MTPRICIVTPGYLSATPRVFREADALAAAGFDVRVVSTQGGMEDLRAFDEATARDRAWRWSVLGWSRSRPEERNVHIRSGVRHRVVRTFPMPAQRVRGVTERAEGRIFPELAVLAASEPADLYIGHYPTGLAAASHAAARHGGLTGYDIEDLYADIRPPSVEWARERARIEALERRYVPGCVHRTAASGPVAAEFAQRYAVDRPLAIHNCHPWNDRVSLSGSVTERVGPALSLYWYSQTVGLDRGLQEVIAAVGLLKGAVQVHIRGAVDSHVRDVLRAMAREHRVDGHIHLHSPVEPAELLARAAEHDVGLAVEAPESLNRQLSVTNKLFLFLTAGLAVAATDLPGQRGVLSSCGRAARLYEPGRPDRLAALLHDWLRSPADLQAAKDAALQAARSRWSWELEAERLVESVRGTLNRCAVRAS